MTGFIVTCEERSTIRNSSTCDTTMIYNVSEFVWPESPRDVQAKLFESICQPKTLFFFKIFLTILFHFNFSKLLSG